MFLDSLRMPQNIIILPVAAQAFLTLGVLLVLAVRRQQSLKADGKTPEDMVLANDADWRRPAEFASRNFKNQFELPVLFYAVCAFLLIARLVDTTQMALATLFVLSRFVHAGFHLAGGRVINRGLAYLVGFAAIALMWLWLVWQILAIGL